MSKCKLIYVAGPYRGVTPQEIELNIQSAKQVGKLCADLGWYPVIPHTNTAGFEHLCPEIKDEFWLENTLELMERCDAVIMCPGWEHSSGSRGEYETARKIGIPVYLTTEELKKNEDR